VIHGDRFAMAIKRAIRDPEIKKIKADVGALDQFTDSTDLTQDIRLSKTLGVVYK
jgi:hypothetical protein